MKFSSICLISMVHLGLAFQPCPTASSTTKLYNFIKPSSDADVFWGGSDIQDLPDKLPKAQEIDEENPMGGQMFRSMMERAKQQGQGQSRMVMNQQDDFQQQQPPQPPQPPQQPQPQYNQQPQYGQQQGFQYGQQPQYGQSMQPQYGQPQPQFGQEQQQQQVFDQYALYQAQLQAWQQQMNAFAQFSAANPQAAAQMTMPPPPQPPMMGQPMAPPPQMQPMATPPPQQQPQPTTTQTDNTPKTPYDYLPKGDGRNSQAYEVNNAADVYFAQLKRDSTVRTEARKRGDLDTANNPMSDEGVKVIGNFLSEELIASRREQLTKSGGEFETSRDEMLLPEHFISEPVPDKTYTGINYKQKLMEAKNKSSPSEQSNVIPTESVPPAQSTNPEFIPSVKPISFDTPAVQAVEPTVAATPEPIEGDEPQQPNFALKVKDESEIDTIPAPSMEDSEENRKSIRTLMGLLLKHRGGPGFGHGRLEGAEAQKLSDMSSDVLSLLKLESGVESITDSVLDTVTKESLAQATRQENPSSPLTGAIACVDAAVNMYRNAESSGQKDLLPSLRDALLSAVSTMNKVISEEQMVTQNTEPTQQPPAPVYATTMEFPETYQVTQKEEEDMKEINDVISGQSSINTERLQKVYDTLKAITGDKKYGLKDVNPEEVRGNNRDTVIVD